VSYQHLRDLTRGRARLSRQATATKNEMHALLTRRNIPSPFVVLFGPRGRRWLASLDLDPVDTLTRDELLARLGHYDAALAAQDRLLDELAGHFPQAEALTCLFGIGRYSALLIVAEIGEPGRFKDGRKVGAYAGLTARVHQSGSHCYRGSITRQGSPWLRWILVEAAIKAIRHDAALKNFYTRVRKRSSAKIARVAVARKLAEICWKRLRRWQREHASQAA
jgi:transposase